MSNQKSSVEQRFGEHLRSARPAAALTQRELAARMTMRGHSWLQSTVTKTEAGERPLRLNEFVALCDVLEQAPTEVLSTLLTESDTDRRRRELEQALATVKQRLDHVSVQKADLMAVADDLYHQLQELDAAEDVAG